MEEIKKESDGRGNVILLTVIAIVTMIIVVVGATFAYLASSVQDSGVSNINATTNGGSDLLLINAGEGIDIVANLENFYDGAGNLTGEVDANILLQTSSETPVTYDYRVYLTVPHNDFEYSSGTCYSKTDSGSIVADSAAACKENNPSNIWATTNGTSYACYGASNPVSNTFYTNEVTCLSNPTYMWAVADTAELVLDLYKSTDATVDKITCEAGGVCVNDKREIVSGATSLSACTSNSVDNTWLPNVYEDGICYNVTKTADLTMVTTTDGSQYALVDNMSITATNGGTQHYYKGIVTLINFGHNQIVNGNKTFNGMLNFERVIKD
ncbi:MAG: hypothetical protein E7167_00240 [Firmicutes bacterium]|nr:hypothetical protein [Bacillota bacterium]